MTAEEPRRMVTAWTPRPAGEHTADCRGRWLHHMPWRPGAAVLAVCSGCPAVRRMDGWRIRRGKPAMRGAR